MKSIVLVALALAAVAVAAPAEPYHTFQILRSNFDQQPEGSYTYGFETENGIKQEQTGELKQVLDEDNKPVDVITMRGSYSYTNEEGKVETVNYYADETGFHAEGDSIPKSVRR